jgi:hypothetical protein
VREVNGSSLDDAAAVEDSRAGQATVVSFERLALEHDIRLPLLESGADSILKTEKVGTNLWECGGHGPIP